MVINDVFVDMRKDTDSCRPETGGLEKPNKKRKKRDPRDQEENQCSELKIENHEGNGKLKKRKTRVEEAHSCGASPVRTAQDQPSPQVESSRKKKKREKLQQSENKIKHEESANHDVGSSRKKKKKSSREKLTVELEENEANIEEPVKKKKKKKKTKQKKKEKEDCSVWTEPVSEVESDAPVAQEIQNNINLKIEPADDFDDVPVVPLKQSLVGLKRRRYNPGGPDALILEELKEFVPKVESLKTVDIMKMIKYDLPRYREFKKKGISPKQGKFTVQENEILRKNVEDFMALTGIDSATKLFFTNRYEEERENIKKLKRLHRFFERIADGIPRSCHCIYERGRRIFDASNHMGKFSKEEVHSLLKLQTLYGNNWKKISKLTGRSPNSLEKRYTQLNKKEGAWSKKEVQRLLRAVRDHIVSELEPGATNNALLRVSKTTLYNSLPWSNIAAKVKTRSWPKCREKWMGILAVKMSSGALCTKKQSKEIRVKLIKAMYELQVDDVANVNWEDLTAVFGDVPPAFVQKKWRYLKVYVPNWQNKCFGDIIDFLYKNVLPLYEEELKEYAGGDMDETQLTKNQQESFLLSDIFQDINDDEADDDD